MQFGSYSETKRINKVDKRTKLYFLNAQRIPFDWKTPSRYLLAWLYQSVGILPIVCFVIQFVNFFIGSSWLFINMAEDITQDVVAFNSIDEPITDENRTEKTRQFGDMVQGYSDAKQ